MKHQQSTKSTDHWHTALDLYETLLLPAESAAAEFGDSVEVMFARVVGHLMLYPPTTDALYTICSELSSYTDQKTPCHHALYDLGKFYVDNLLSICE